MFNVLKGDMSFVGPRPERPFFVATLKETIPYYHLRFAVKPGITGWAQISYGYGANEADAIEKLQYDIYYVKNMSPLFDLQIIFETIKVVLLGKGAQ
jgi:lipopolysaccharide/colanic/teichoic acid biosynthesis glycosyltransferase